MAEDWYGTVLQVAALLGIASTAIYLFIALKNYTKEQREDANKRQTAFDERLKLSGERVINQITNNFEGQIKDVRKDLTARVEQLNELKIEFKKVSEKLEELDKKCIIYDYKIPELQEIKKMLETIKNAVVKIR
jgi:septal ring factor EnvC (AmiA/AmiB activator)